MFMIANFVTRRVMHKNILIEINHPWPNALSLVETQFYYYRRRFTSYVTHLASARWFESVIRVVQIRINFRIYRIFQGINGIHWLIGEVHRIQRSVSNRYFDGAIFVHRVRGPAIKWERDRAKLQWRLFKLTGTRRALRLDAGPIFTRHRSVSVSILSIVRVRLRFWKHSKICFPRVISFNVATESCKESKLLEPWS